jgi:AcrR family transcriptional regulator
MNMRRGYNMASRSAGAAATRERILDEAGRLFMAHYYEDVSIALVAREAGVSAQTLLNHFGGKERLFAEAIERVSNELQQRRWRAEPGDVAGAIRILVEDYEITGDATIRLLSVEDRLPIVREVADRGRQGHREWVERVFAAPDRTSELIVVADVYTWKLLRRDQRLSVGATTETMWRMADAILRRPSDQPTTERRSA